MTKTRDLADLGGGFIQAGTGATQRTVELKLQDMVSVKDFGAVGDGTADDTAAINAAITAAGSGCLHVPAGTYKITAPLNSGNSIPNLRIIGDSRDTSIFKYFGTTGTMLYLNVGSLENIQLLSNGNKSDGNNVSGIRISGPSKVTRCTISNFSNAGIIVESQYASVIESCKISSNTHGILGDGTIWSGISVTSLTVQFNQILSNTYGFYSDSNNDVWRLIIENNLIDYNDTGLYIATHNATISNNWVEHSTVSGGTIVNTYITLIGNRHVGALDNFTVQNSGLPVELRGYTNIDQSHTIAARQFQLINAVGLNDTNADSVDLINYGDELKLLNSNYTAGFEPRLMTSPSQVKVNTVRYNYTYSGGPDFISNNTGFTVTRHAAGKYHVNFNRAISHFMWFVSGHKDMYVTSDGSGYTTADGVRVSAVATNPSTGNWRSYSQAQGMVVLIEDTSGTLVDGQFCLQIIEQVSNIFSY